MPDVEPGFEGGPVEAADWEAVARSDRFVDALAQCRPVDFIDPGDGALAALLQDWRDELRCPAADPLVSEGEVAAALRSGMAARRHSRRGLAVIGSVAATVMLLGGFGALVVAAHPGDPLYGLQTMLIGKREVSENPVLSSAKTQLDEVQQMIAQGQWDQAEDQLAAVSTAVQTVNDEDRKQDLVDQLNLLTAKVASRDPNATLPANRPSNPEVPPNSEAPTSPAANPEVPVPPSDSEAENTMLPPSSAPIPDESSPPEAGPIPPPEASAPPPPDSATDQMNSTTVPTPAPQN